MRLAVRALLVGMALSAALLVAQINFHYSFYQTSGQGLGAVSADFNRDGYPDVVVGTNGAVELFLSTGNGTNFGAPQSYTISGNNPNDMVAVDINGDGWPDLVVMSSDNSTTVSVFLNNGDGTLRAGTPITLAAPAGSYIGAGDLNNDGKADLVISELVNGGQSDQFAIYLGNGDGSFTAGQVLPLAALASRPVVYDLNRDGKLDIAAVVHPDANIFWGNGDGTFSGPMVIPASDQDGDNDLTVADFNNDSSPDLAIETSHFCGSACGTNTVYIYLGNGAGAFAQKSSYVVQGVSAGGYLTAADLNDDQNIDLVVENPAHFGGAVVYAMGNGDGSFGTQGVFNGATETSGFVARDVNLDSRPDVVIPTWMGNGFIFGLNTSASVNCPPPDASKLQAKICTPGAQPIQNPVVVVRGAGNSPLGIRRLEIWMDGNKVAEELNSQIKKVISVTPGRHDLTLVAVDQYLGYSSTTIRIVVP